ncbi:MAG TPA: hypothetical protein VFV87_20915 [Pirellulaceae bacterium]|nr:hypothetical protein [Pirellulaceae bacterium]
MALGSPSPLLTVPTDRQERWKLVREVIRQWFPADLSKLALPLGMSPITAPPTACGAIQEWYRIVREAPEVWCQQDHLFGAGGDWRRGDYLTIAVENQVCAYWGVPRSELDQEDPPVFLDRGRGAWEVESPTTSEFALTWLAYSIKWSHYNRGGANGSLDDTALELIKERFPRLKLTDWHWPDGPTRFYGTADLLLETNGDNPGAWLWVSARTKAAFREFQSLVSTTEIRWESSSDEWPDGWVSAADDPE